MDRYVLPPAKRLVVRLLGVVFFVMALFQVADAPIPLVAPHLTAPAWHSAGGLIGEPEALLPYKARERVETDAGVKARFLAHLAEPTVRVRHLLLTLAIDGPVFLILFGMAMALWRSTRLVPDAVEQGLWWLMTVGWATVICALTYPILDGMRTVVLLSGVIPTPSLIWYDPATGGMTYIMLLIAAGILAATWTISAGLKARRDMAEFV